MPTECRNPNVKRHLADLPRWTAILQFTSGVRGFYQERGSPEPQRLGGRNNRRNIPKPSIGAAVLRVGRPAPLSVRAAPAYRGVLTIGDTQDLWSAPAGRSGDGALARRNPTPSEPKRGRTSLAPALQSAGRRNRMLSIPQSPQELELVPRG